MYMLPDDDDFCPAWACCLISGAEGDNEAPTFELCSERVEVPLYVGGATASPPEPEETPQPKAAAPRAAKAKAQGRGRGRGQAKAKAAPKAPATAQEDDPEDGDDVQALESEVLSLAAPTVPATAPGITKNATVRRYFLKPLPASIGTKCAALSRASPTIAAPKSTHHKKVKTCDPGVASVKRRLTDMNALVVKKPDAAAKKIKTDKVNAPKHLKHILG